MLRETIKPEDLDAPVLPEGHPVRFDAGGPFMFARILHFRRRSGNGPLEIAQEPPESTRAILSDAASVELLEAQLTKAKADIEKIHACPHLLNNLGSILLNNGQFDEARACFTEAIELHPGFYEAQSNLAKAYVKEGRVEDALQVYETLLKQQPDDTRVLMNIAHAYLRMDELDRSSEYLDKIIKLDRGNASAYHNRGLLKMAQKRWGEAVGDLRRATRLNVRFVDAYNALGVCYLLQGSLAKAERALRTALALAPFNDDATINFVLLLHMQGRPEEALTTIEEYIQRRPRDLAARFLQAASLVRLRQLDKCMKVLDRMDDLTEELSEGRELKPWVKFHKATVYEMREDDGRAESEYRDAIELARAIWEDSPLSVFFYAGLAFLYMRQDRLEDARRMLQTCEDQYPDDPLVSVVLSLVNLKEGHYQEALRLAEKAVECGPENGMAQYLRGSIYAKLGEYDEAISCYQLALRIRPNHPLFVNALAYRYLMKGDTQRAREVLDDAQIDHPGPFLTATRGLLLVKEGDLPEGRRLYNQAAKMVRGSELRNLIRQKKHLELGRKLLELGETAKAQRELHKVGKYETADQDYLNEAQRLLDSINTDLQARLAGHPY